MLSGILLVVGMRITAGIATCLMSVAALIRLLHGAHTYDYTITNAHLIDALSSALVLTSTLLLLAALSVMFPPFGGLVLADIGEMMMAAAADDAAMAATATS